MLSGESQTKAQAISRDLRMVRKLVCKQHEKNKTEQYKKNQHVKQGVLVIAGRTAEPKCNQIDANWKSVNHRAQNSLGGEVAVGGAWGNPSHRQLCNSFSQHEMSASEC